MWVAVEIALLFLILDPLWFALDKQTMWYASNDCECWCGCEYRVGG